MTKNEFINELGARLKGLPEKDIDERLMFYSEIIDDHIEDGISEEEAVEQIGSVDKIAKQILSEATPLIENISPSRKWKPWQVILIAVGSPVWVTLGLVVLSVALSLFVVLWSLIAALWGIDASFAMSFPPGIVSGFALIFNNDVSAGWATIGIAVVLAGLAILLFFGCLAATKGAYRLTKKLILWIAGLFGRKEKQS